MVYYPDVVTVLVGVLFGSSCLYLGCIYYYLISLKPKISHLIAPPISPPFSKHGHNYAIDEWTWARDMTSTEWVLFSLAAYLNLAPTVISVRQCDDNEDKMHVVMSRMSRTFKQLSAYEQVLYAPYVTLQIKKMHHIGNMYHGDLHHNNILINGGATPCAENIRFIDFEDGGLFTPYNVTQYDSNGKIITREWMEFKDRSIFQSQIKIN